MNNGNPLHALSLLVCDLIITDVFTRKHSVIGIFNTLRVPGFPHHDARMGVFAQVTGGNPGKVRMKIRCTGRVSGGLVFESRRTVVHIGGDDLTELQFAFSNITFPIEGVYSLALLANRVLLAETHFNVLPAKSG
jgi:hypothetical protein